MSYVASVLQPGERVVRVGHLHWIVYWLAILFALLAILCTPLASTGGWRVVMLFAAMAFAVLAVVAFGLAWFKRWTTEIAITDRRIIYKEGFINRRTCEMNMDKVASVDVSQSILGRLLDYGSIRVGGIGGAQSSSGSDTSRARSDRASGIERLERVAQPLALRSAITAK